MSAFADAMAAIVADPNLGMPAIYRVGGIGTGVAIRIARSAPDETFDAFGTTLVRPTDVLLVATADVLAPAILGLGTSQRLVPLVRVRLKWVVEAARRR